MRRVCAARDGGRWSGLVGTLMMMCVRVRALCVCAVLLLFGLELDLPSWSFALAAAGAVLSGLPCCVLRPGCAA